MKAIILAAGEGRRLRPFTNDRPKCMVPFHGRPILQYQLDVFHSCGIQDIVVVTGYRDDAIKLDGVLCVRNTRYHETNMVYSLFCAEKHLNDDTVVSYGDIVFDEHILKALLASEDDIAVTIDLNWLSLWQMRTEDPLSDAETLKLNEQGYIVELGRKPHSLLDIQGQYMGLFMLRRRILPSVIAHYHAMDQTRLYEGRTLDNMFMTSFLQDLIDNGFHLRAIPVRGGWIEIDRPSDLRLFPLPVS